MAAGHVLIAAQSAAKGLDKVQPDAAAIARDLEAAWEVLGEAIQTVMRCHGIEEPYEKLKELTRGKAVTRELLHDFVATLEIPEDARQRLLELAPATYTGLAAQLARMPG